MTHPIARNPSGALGRPFSGRGFLVPGHPADVAPAWVLPHRADDPLARLLPGVGNQGGFRALGRHSQDAVRLVVLYTSGAEPDWPDALDPYTGAFTYFGDDRSPGRTLHDTPRKGNLLLDTVFTRTHAGRKRPRADPSFLLRSSSSVLLARGVMNGRTAGSS